MESYNNGLRTSEATGDATFNNISETMVTDEAQVIDVEDKQSEASTSQISYASTMFMSGNITISPLPILLIKAENGQVF